MIPQWTAVAHKDDDSEGISLAAEERDSLGTMQAKETFSPALLSGDWCVCACVWHKCAL